MSTVRFSPNSAQMALGKSSYLKIAFSWGSRDAGAGVCSDGYPCAYPSPAQGKALALLSAFSPPWHVLCLAQLGCELSRSALEKQQKNNNDWQWLHNHSIIQLISASVRSWGCSPWASITSVHPLTCLCCSPCGCTVRRCIQLLSQPSSGL